MNKLIAFVGRAQSGKNTAAKFLKKQFGYTEVSFALPLKKVVCEIYGLNLKKMESGKYKETPHPYLNPIPKWQKYLYKFTGINLTPKNGVNPREVLQRVAEEGFGYDPRYLYVLCKFRRSPKLLNLIKYVYDVDQYNYASRIPNIHLTLGQIYSEIGYKGFSALYQNTWVDKLFRTIDQLNKEGKRVVITDCRRPYELNKVLEKGGAAIYIDRPNLKPDSHPSEQVENLRSKCSYVVFNCYTPNYLYFQLEKALTSCRYKY